MSATATLDARRLLCPMPVIRVQRQVEGLPAGTLLEVTFTDPGAQYDIPAWCRVHGHRVVSLEQRDDEFLLTVEVSGS